MERLYIQHLHKNTGPDKDHKLLKINKKTTLEYHTPQKYSNIQESRVFHILYYIFKAHSHSFTFTQ